MSEPSAECPEQARNVRHWQQNVAQALSGHEIGKVDKRPFREVPTVSRIPPATGAEAIEEVYVKREKVKGLKMVYEPKYLRFFQARFEPLG